VLNAKTFGTFEREYSPLTLRTGIMRVVAPEIKTGTAGWLVSVA